MSTLSLFVCAPAGQNSDGSCASGQGSWQSVTVNEPFDPASLNAEELTGAFGVGFTTMATLLLIIWAARTILKAVK